MMKDAINHVRVRLESSWQRSFSTPIFSSRVPTCVWIGAQFNSVLVSVCHCDTFENCFGTTLSRFQNIGNICPLPRQPSWSRCIFYRSVVPDDFPPRRQSHVVYMFDTSPQRTSAAHRDVIVCLRSRLPLGRWVYHASLTLTDAVLLDTKQNKHNFHKTAAVPVSDGRTARVRRGREEQP